MTLIQKIDFVLTPPHGRAFRVDARFIPDQQAKPVVIFVHGFKGFKDWGHFNLIADYFAQQGFVFIKLNLSHNGTTLDSEDLTDMEAFGQNNFSIELDDLDTLLNYLFSLPENLPKAELNLDKVSLIGHSRGGGLVILKAAEEERVKAVVGWAPISDLLMRWPEEVLTNWQKTGVHYIYNSRINQDMPLYYQLVEDFKANQERLDIPAVVKNLKKPFLIIHAEDDETLPVSMADELKANQPQAEVIILPAGGHTFGGKHPFPDTNLPPSAQTVAERTVEFLKKL
ncbi:alpha/beta hydrolase family protein [Adhaeribacter pallidiroseus]|uniref:DNA-(Apurinic or apyrimidinic site) lyase n=1 Tax=Adhaeribacter pallidiroseus TaxID=2072847 RepID=A0A369QKJ8_9BACT|nr:alpha/beta fold hydrolase [Adhaeribacter pallidiroseus]RDC64850.1 DNA-(apurinic or apyrimidinic site) lyase [Adhaeribacter pallidiroseus]